MHRHGGANGPRIRLALTLAMAGVFFAAPLARVAAQEPLFGISDDAALVAPRTLRFGVRADFLYTDALRRADGERVPLAASLGFASGSNVSVVATVSETRLPITLEYGLLRRLTLGASVPLVRRRVEVAADTNIRAAGPASPPRLTDLSALASLNHTNVGDVDFTARIGVIDGFASRAPLRIRLSLEGVFRLGAGPSRNGSVFIDPGTGDGQNDVEARVFGDVGIGRNVVISARAAHTIQRADRQTVVYADSVFPSRQIRSGVQRDLGDITTVEIVPRFRLTRFLAIALDVAQRSKTADEYTGGAPAPGWGLVAEPVGQYSVTRAGFGVIFSTGPGAIGSWPVDLQFQHARIVHSTGAAIPDFSLDQIGGRVYIKLF